MPELEWRLRLEVVRASPVQCVGQEVVMAKRERFVTSVTCPVCALSGSATWEENESGNLETTIKNLSHGFRIGSGSEILCANCGVKARIIGITSGAKQTG